MIWQLVLLGSFSLISAAYAEDELTHIGEPLTPKTATQIEVLASAELKPLPVNTELAEVIPANTEEEINQAAKRMASEVPVVLSTKDVELYKQLFRAQRRNQVNQAQVLAKQISNPILLGQAEALRLTNRGRASTFTEMQSFLAKHPDHHQAKTIYEWALKKRPKGATLVKPLGYDAALAKKPAPTDEPDEDSVGTGSAKERRALLNRLKSLRRAERFDQAAQLLLQPSTRRTLGTDAVLSAGTTLVRSMMNNDEVTRSYNVTKELMGMAGKPTPELRWMAGFAAYQRERYADAARYLSDLVKAVDSKNEYYSRGAYWAARAYQKVNNDRAATEHLRLATANPFSFYGLLATEMLGRNIKADWQAPALEAEAEKIFKNKAVQRVIALAQVAETDLAQKELQFNLDGEALPKNQERALLAMALKMELPGSALTLARSLNRQNQTIAAGLYPHSERWQPRDGQKIDEALMFAIMRQESAFKPGVSSRVGARGLMQVMPGTAKHIRKELRQGPISRDQMYDIPTNLQLGQEYLIWMLGEFDGNLMHAIAAYNAGPGNVRKWAAADPESDPVLFMERIPFKETRKYVELVMANLWMYRQKFDNEPKTLADVARGRWPIYENRYAVAYGAWLDARRAAYAGQ